MFISETFTYVASHNTLIKLHETWVDTISNGVGICNGKQFVILPATLLLADEHLHCRRQEKICYSVLGSFINGVIK